MSIQSEITRISGNVSDALTAIAQKGVTVPSGSNSDDLADLISQISSGGTDFPKFTIIHDSETGDVASVFCDKTFAQCSEYMNNGKAYGERVDVWDEEYSSYGTVCWFDRGDNYIIYTAMDNTYPAYDIRYNSDGTFTTTTPSVQNTTLNITQNGTIYPSGVVTEVNVNVPSTPTLQTKSVSYTPETTQRVHVVTPDSGYDALSSVDITVGAMPIGTAGTPTATKGTVSNHSVSITPSVTNSTGYITGSTKTGTAVSVSASELVSGTKTISENGTGIDVTNYASVDVNVASSGGSSAWTKVAETSYQVSTTSTSTATVATWATGHSELWTSDKLVYVRIRDTAGKRAGYFYGTDQFFMIASTSATSTTSGARFYIRCSTSMDLSLNATSGTTGYGIFSDTLYNDGRIRVRSRYHSTNSLTIDGTYKVEVYLLDPPTGAPIFE